MHSFSQFQSMVLERTTSNMSTRKYPKAVVFDLDYTIWPCWCDTHISSPFKPHPKKPNTVLDRYNYELAVYPDVYKILTELNDNGVQVYSASRTATPKVAMKLMKLFKIDQFFHDSAWGGGSKVKHLTELSNRNDVDFSEMCLYDDEMRNRDVEDKLGVKFVHLPNEDVGLTYYNFQKGLDSWEKFNHK